MPKVSPLDCSAGFCCCFDLSYFLLVSSPAEHKTFKWTIDGFSSLLDKGAGWTCSSVFEFMGMIWYGFDTALVALLSSYN